MRLNDRRTFSAYKAVSIGCPANSALLNVSVDFAQTSLNCIEISGNPPKREMSTLLKEISALICLPSFSVANCIISSLYTYGIVIAAIKKTKKKTAKAMPTYFNTLLIPYLLSSFLSYAISWQLRQKRLLL